MPNGSFEVYDSCPSYLNEGISLVPPWYSPTAGTPDYLNHCDTTYFSVPSNQWGYQNAHTGVACVGMGMYWVDTPSYTVYREYIQVKLSDSLIANKKYCVNFYVSLAEIPNNATTIVSITEIGMLFSNNPITSTTSYPLTYSPQIKSPVGVFMSDTTNWMQISGTYTAIGGEQYITIGNFKSDANTDTSVIIHSGSQTGAYYYIDDVSVIDCTNAGISEIINPKSEILISPNPTTGIFTIHTEGTNIKEIKVFTVLGEEVITNYELGITNAVSIDVSGIAKGIYFVQITVDSAGSPTKNVINKKIVVQ